MFLSIQIQFLNLQYSPSKQNMTHEQNLQNINPNINFDFKENSPFQEGITSETFQRPEKLFFQYTKELGDPINMGNFVHKYLPKQTNIDKILELIQKKILKGIHLPMKSKKFRQVIYVVYISKVYTYICLKINSHLQNQQSENWKH